MIDELKEIVELATSLTIMTGEILKFKPNNKNAEDDEIIIANKKYSAKIGSSGDSAKIGSSGDFAQIGISGNYAQIGSSGNYAQIGSSGNYAQIGSSGNYAQIGISGNYAQIGISGDSAQIGSSGYYAQIGSSGYYAQIGSSGNYAQIGSSGNYAQIGSSGNYAKIGSSGNYAKIGSSGNYAKIGISGNYAQIGSSGNYAKIGSSGNYAKIGISGNYAQIGISGNYAKINSTGKNSVIASIGFRDIVKAKKSSWITLAEYKQDKNYNWIIDFIKTEQVDGEIIKEDIYYTLYNHQFVEVEIIDDIKTIILQRKKNVIKGLFLDSLKSCYVIEKGGVFAHGATLKEAIENLIYKITDRDKSDYKDYTLDTKVTHEEAIKMYRIITGACEAGTRHFVENVLIKKKKKYTVKEIIKLTKGQYGNATLKEFMRDKNEE